MLFGSLPISLNSNFSPSVLLPIIIWQGIPSKLNFLILDEKFPSVSSIIKSIFFSFKKLEILFAFSKFLVSFLFIKGRIAQSKVDTD